MSNSPITFEQWQQTAAQFPNLGEAEQYRQHAGIEVIGLPPTAMSRAMTAPQQGAPSLAVQPATPAAPPLGGLGGLAAQPAAPSLATEAQNFAADAEKLYADRFGKERERIQTMYGGPSTAQTLFALSEALLAPRRMSGFAGTMHNVSQALGGIEKQRVSASQKRAEALAALGGAYADKTMDARATGLKTRVDLSKIEQQQREDERKAGEPKYDINPLTGRYMQRPNTGLDLGILTREQVLMASQDPRNKGRTFTTEDGRQGVIG